MHKPADIPAGIIKSGIGLLGFSSILTQVLFLREFLAVLTGNELLIGILLFNWMLLTGLGAYLGRLIHEKQIGKFILIFHSLLALLPMISILVLFRSRYLLFTPGLELNLQEVLFFSFLMLAPFCLTSGLLFNLYASILQGTRKNQAVARTYAIESAGSVLGGILSAFILIRYINLYQSLLLILILNMGIAILFSYFYLKKHFYIPVIIQLFATFIFILLIPSDLNKSRIFPGQKLLMLKESNYGSVAVTESGNQLNFYENGSLLFTSASWASNEEVIHYPFALHKNPRRILLISGNYKALLGEIDKYENTQTDYLEINPEVVNAQQEFLLKSEVQNQSEINTYVEDPVYFIKSQDKQYDLIIMNLPPPTSAMINRFYSNNFFAEAKEVLGQNGILSFSLPSAENYAGESLLDLLSSIYKTLQGHFREIRIVSGQQTYFLASQSTLDANLLARVEKLGIDNLYVNINYIRPNLMNMRSELLEESLIADAPVNKDLRPVAYYFQLRSWLHAYNIEISHLLAALILAILLILGLTAPVNFALFAGGFTAASIEFIIILAFQVIYANIYQFIGLIIAVFMLGLYLGSIFWAGKTRSVKKGTFLFIHVFIGLTALSIPWTVYLINDWPAGKLFIQTIILLMTLLISFLTGSQYAVASLIYTEKAKLVAGKTYLSDMSGSAIGILTTSVFLVPLFGVGGTGLILFTFNTVSIANTYFRSGRI